MTRYECKITPSVLRGVWVPGTFLVLAFVGGYVCMRRLLTVRTRRAVSAPCPFPCRTRSCTRWWSQWSAPGSSPARRRSSGHLGEGGGRMGRAECREREKRWTPEHPLRTGGSDAFASVCLLHLGHRADVRHLVLSCLPISLGSRLGFFSRHDDWGEEKSEEERGEEVKKWEKKSTF